MPRRRVYINAKSINDIAHTFGHIPEICLCTHARSRSRERRITVVLATWKRRQRIGTRHISELFPWCIGQMSLAWITKRNFRRVVVSKHCKVNYRLVFLAIFPQIKFGNKLFNELFLEIFLKAWMTQKNIILNDFDITLSYLTIFKYRMLALNWLHRNNSLDATGSRVWPISATTTYAALNWQATMHWPQKIGRNYIFFFLNFLINILFLAQNTTKDKKKRNKYRKR